MRKEQFGSNAPHAKLTVRMERALYQRLHAHCAKTLAPHNKVIVRAVECFLSKDCERKG